MKKKIIVSVTNDLTSDKRVDRVCCTLVKMGYDVLLVGRQRKESLPLKPRDYRMKRMHLLFSKGPAFYAEYNLRLFFFLLFSNPTILLSNDLDTLAANALAARILKIPHIHDCHEYFRGVPELNGRPFPAKVWKIIEDKTFPKLDAVYAVNSSIAGIYSKEYGKSVEVIRNVPRAVSGSIPEKTSLLNLPEGKKVILYQGSVNVDRGLEEAISAMKYVKSDAILLIIGTGDVIGKLKDQVIREELTAKVRFTGEIPFQELNSYTALADIGLSIEKDISLNYHYCLPNKFLDYIQARVPVLVSPLPEMMAIVEKYYIGEMIESHDPEYLASKFQAMLENETRLELYRKNLEAAAKELCWENEEQILINIFKKYA